MGFLTLLAGKQIFGNVISEKASKVITLIGLALLLLVMMAGAKCAYDSSVIERHEARQDAANAKADRKADAKAAEQRRADDSRIAQEGGQLEKVQSNANTPVDRRLARHRCLRLQQAARAAGRQPPACG